MGGESLSKATEVRDKTPPGSWKFPGARNRVREYETLVRSHERQIAKLQALVERLQVLGYQCSAEQRETAIRAQQEREAGYQAFLGQARAILSGGVVPT
jgi:hypothetical protein